MSRETVASPDVKTPSLVAGHAVRSPGQITVASNGKYIVYAATPHMVAVVDTTTGVRSLLSQAAYYSLPDLSEEIAFVQAHAERDILCVGTTCHGLYVTTIKSPIFSQETRLPLDVSGERMHCACFVAAPSPPQDESPAAPTGSDLLVISSTFSDRKGSSPHRLSLWSVDDRSLLCRVPMDPLENMCAFTHIGGAFAACTRTKVFSYTIQRSSSEAKDGTPRSTHSKGKLVMFNRLCGTVKAIQESEFVQCAYSPDAADNTFVALTSNGFLVAYDRSTGLVVRWMDCKVCPASSVRFSPQGYVVLAGAMVRFFKTDSWEFSGKIKPEVATGVAHSSFLGKLLSSIYAAAVSIGSEVVLPSRSGELSVCQCDAGKGGRITVRSLFHFLPIPTDPPVLAASEGGAWCVWSPHGLRLYSARVHLRKFIEFESSCAAYHAGSKALLAYHTSTAEVVAYSCSREKGDATEARIDHHEQMSSLCASSSGDFFAGLHSTDKTVYAFRCERSRSDESLTLTALWNKAFPADTGNISRIVCIDSNVFAVTERALIELQSGREHQFADPIVDVCTSNSDAVILHDDYCIRFDPSDSTVPHVRLTSPIKSLTRVFYDGSNVAVCSAADAAVFSATDSTLYGHVALDPTTTRIVSISLRPAASSSSHILSLWDAQGRLVEYTIDSPTACHSAAVEVPLGTRTSRATAASSSQGSGARARRAFSAGGPTHRQLSDRFEELTGFFNQSQRGGGGARTPRAAATSRREAPAHHGSSTVHAPKPPVVPTSPIHIPVTDILKSPQRPESTPSSSPKPVTSTALRHTTEDVFATGVSVDVSALTIPTALGSCDAAIELDSIDVPQPCAGSPVREGDLNPETCQPVGEDAVNMASVVRPSTDGSDVGDNARAEGADPNIVGCPVIEAADGRNARGSTQSFSSISEHTRHLRDSLMQLKDWLANTSCDEDDEDDAAELDELPSLLSAVSDALLRRQGRGNRGKMPAEPLDDEGGSSTDSYRNLLSELQRIQKQNERLEAQNKTIMDKLEAHAS